MDKKIILIVITILVIGTIIFVQNRDITGNVITNTRMIGGGQKAEVIDISEPVKVDYITQMLYGLGANELHTPLFSGDNPKIEIVIDSVIYNSEIVKGKIITQRGGIEEEDLRIVMSKEDFYTALSGNTQEHMKGAVAQGNVQIFKVAGDLELYRKGYLDLYESIAG